MFAIKSDPKVTEAYGAEPHRSIEETKEWAIGSCCYWHFDWESKCAELGHELHRSYWGKGIMTEALVSVLAYGLDGVRLNRVEASPLAENAASSVLLLKLGFKHEGNLRQRVFFRGRDANQYYYGLLKSEWSPMTSGAPAPGAV